MQRCKRVQGRPRGALLVAIALAVAAFAVAPNGSLERVSAATVTAPGPVAIGDTVTGNTTVDAVDAYPLFVPSPGATIVLRVAVDACECEWALTGPNGNVFDQGLGDFGPRWLASGDYMLTVNSFASGSYQFDVLAAPAPQSFNTALGAVVSSGVPAAGAGAIESPGAQDAYAFTVPSGGAGVVLSVLANSCACEWSLRAASGPQIFDRHPMEDTRVGLASGTYSLRVVGGGAATGSYSFANERGARGKPVHDRARRLSFRRRPRTGRGEPRGARCARRVRVLRRRRRARRGGRIGLCRERFVCPRDAVRPDALSRRRLWNERRRRTSRRNRRLRAARERRNRSSRHVRVADRLVVGPADRDDPRRRRLRGDHRCTGCQRCSGGGRRQHRGPRRARRVRLRRLRRNNRRPRRPDTGRLFRFGVERVRAGRVGSRCRPTARLYGNTPRCDSARPGVTPSTYTAPPARSAPTPSCCGLRPCPKPSPSRSARP